MLHKLFHRGLPGCFRFDSVYAMQPMYTSGKNKEILEGLKTMAQFSMQKPTVPKPKVIIKSHTAVCQILDDVNNIQSPWAATIGTLVSGTSLKGFDTFQNQHHGNQIFQLPSARKICSDSLCDTATAAVRQMSYFLNSWRGSYYQIDMIRE